MLFLTLTIVSGGVNVSSTGLAAQSIIKAILDTSQAVVNIKAETGTVFGDKPKAFRGPKGGIFIMRKARPFFHVRAGAGAIIDAAGIVVTNAHVVKGAGRITVTLQDQEQLTAELLHIVPGQDIAFLRIRPTSKLTSITFSDSDRARIGNTVYTVGTSNLLRGSISEGKINGLGQQGASKLPGGPKFTVLQVAFDIYKGDSGSPLLDNEGRLLGIMAATQTKIAKVSYAIPANLIRFAYFKYLSTLTPPESAT